jgi:hypothetical protein
MCERAGSLGDAQKAYRNADRIQYCVAYVRAKCRDWSPEVNEAVAGAMYAADPHDLEIVDIHPGAKRFRAATTLFVRSRQRSARARLTGADGCDFIAEISEAPPAA